MGFLRLLLYGGEALNSPDAGGLEQFQGQVKFEGPTCTQGHYKQ